MPCVLLSPQEATELSSLKPELEKLGVPLYAVVKENIGTEVHDFKPHFAGDVFVDEKVRNVDVFVRKYIYINIYSIYILIGTCI